MNKYTKAISTIAIIGIAATGVIMTQSNSDTLKGSIMVNKNEITRNKAYPDIVSNIEITQNKKGEDLSVKATISNIGNKKIESEFTYEIKINGKSVIKNKDKYMNLEKGNSFSFILPISKEMYKYPETGKITFTVDTENNIKEENENNNTKTIEYKEI